MEHKLLSIKNFATLGDDNCSGHDSKSSIDKLETEQENHGFIINYPKRYISKKGYLLGEELRLLKFVKGQRKFVQIPNFKMRVVTPKTERGNHWVTMPQVALMSCKNASSRLRQRVMSLVFSLYRKAYSYCLNAQLNIFNVPTNKPMFPYNLFPKKENYLYEAWEKKQFYQIKNIFTPVDETQPQVNRLLMRGLIDQLHNEGTTWSLPSFGTTQNDVVYADKREWNKGDLLDSLTARAIPNPYRNPNPSKRPNLLTAQECVHRFLKIKGDKHINPSIHSLNGWEDQKVKTSLMGILANESNFDVASTFGNEVYDDTKLEVYLVDGSRDFGCQLGRLGDEHELELACMGASKHYSMFSTKSLFIVISPPFTHSPKDRQRIVDSTGSYFATWFLPTHKRFEDFIYGCSRTFRNHRRKTFVSTRKVDLPGWYFKSPAEFFVPSRDKCLEEGFELCGERF